jgi:hypothetical protein
MIPLGDIDLQREITLDNTGVVNHRRERPRARRIYIAKIDGRQADVTVAVYQGQGAEEVCTVALFSVFPDNLCRNGDRT